MDRTVVIMVAQCKVNYFGTDFKPWALYDIPDITEKKFAMNG